MKNALLYLASQLGVNVVHSNLDLQSKRFSSEDSDIEKAIEKFQVENRELIKIHYDKDRKTIICSDKRIGATFEELLKSKIILDKGSKLHVLFGRKKKELQINGNSLQKSKEAIQEIILTEWGKTFPANLTVQELIFNVFTKEKNSSCEIHIPVRTTPEEEEREKKHIAELKQRIEAIEEGSDKAGGWELEDLKEMFKRMETPTIQEQSSFDIYFHERGSKKNSEKWQEPTYEQVAEFLKLSEKGQIMKAKRLHKHIEFFFYKFIAFDAIIFLPVLIENDVFDNPPEMTTQWLLYVGSIPHLLMESDDYKAIQYLLKNMHKIKSKEGQKGIIDSFSKLDKNRLDKESLDIFLSLAKEFKIERIYVDTSKWIGDDLPDDYDRWQNFKISEIKLAHEEDKTIGKTRYHLKFYKYKTPVKIGGIPLKKFEEADYSTPEKAHFSSLSARTYEWKKASYYGDFSRNEYSPLDNWKRWNSGLDRSIEVIYKVEIAGGSSHQDGNPGLFLVKKILYENNKIVAIPMMFDNGKWKSILSWSVHTDILSNYIEEKIAKFDK
jgi:hypothetical protein